MVSALIVMAVSLVGCSAVNVQPVKMSSEVLPEYAPDIPASLADFLEFERYTNRGGDVTLVGNLTKTEDIETEAFLRKTHSDLECAESVSNPEDRDDMLPYAEDYEAELVGNVWGSIPEPELVEDPLVEEYCIENANSWCDPTVEEVYVAHLATEKKLRETFSILPNFISPVEQGMVLRGMQAQRKGKRGHYGVDLIPISMQGRGAPIKAVEDGIVVMSGRTSGYGYYAVLYHQNGVFTLYSHMLKDKLVKVGRNVKQGDLIGLMGKTGNARGYHLHFELIDLREMWTLPENVDTFIAHVQAGNVQKQELNQFCVLLFNKTAKQDPLAFLPDLALAERANGTWIASMDERTKSAVLASTSSRSVVSTSTKTQTPARTQAKVVSSSSSE